MNIHDAEDNEHLSAEQLAVLRDKGTEVPYSGQYLNHSESGVYTCAACGTELFQSDQKYESNQLSLRGWPSFADAAASGAIRLEADDSHGMHRTEVVCATCGGHLGHLFDDESSPSGKHYCINSVCLGFSPKQKI